MDDAECQRIESGIRALTDKFGAFQLEISQRLTRLEQQVANEGALCPFRESISRASNNIKRIEELEEELEKANGRVRELELAMARSSVLAGAAGGGIFTAVGAVIYGIGKAAGAW